MSAPTLAEIEARDARAPDSALSNVYRDRRALIAMVQELNRLLTYATTRSSARHMFSDGFHDDAAAILALTETKSVRDARPAKGEA